ncbi:MBL fold metallo-hydrolase RNA specificity domain-containing protein [Legionella spiritensis]|uniref:MBL fold metallo-hydrolase RNA specificity domain-containing protein n=1 Tax=Legionella spiritensis TaxID=452 RepID=UPI000F6C5F5C|nr:MBL fold metallo-hydrolase [Legionella spiritensis]VEG90076.1 metallo-beta-lactamase superfamily protein [Legionella spiritensis]
MKLSFLGATETVTGSKYLVECGNRKILIDCGLFQGLKDLRLRNWHPLPVEPSSIDAVLLTHAHIDHSGYLPLLVKNGFQGSIYATRATTELCNILLPDSGHLHEEDANRANKYGYSKHHPALPLYTESDALIALKQFVPVNYNQAYSFFESLQCRWYRAGHILGSSFIEIKHNSTKLLFSGDIGRHHDPVMKPWQQIDQTDYLVLESTYGNRLHEKSDPMTVLAAVINATAKRGGTLLIPAFAVGRAQTMLYYLYHLKQSGLIPDLPIFLDSPMAIDATQVLLNNSDEHLLTPKQCFDICHVAHYVNTPEQSKSIDRMTVPKIIISASGMMSGGRILHHLKVFGPDPQNTILLTGYQAKGTRGARMVAHEPEIKIHGQMVPIRASIEMLANTSAHADYEEILLWLGQFKEAPKTTFITHGEPEASLALKEHIEEQLGWNCVIPHYLDTMDLC